MKYAKLIFIISGLIGVLLWITGRRRDRAFEYPAEPEPPHDWWTTTSIPAEDIFTWITG